MPNWCFNNLMVNGSESDMTIFNNWLGDDGLSLKKIIPTPEELANTTAPNPNPKSKEAKALVKKYGHDNWYDWNVENWGTKWDITPELVDENDKMIIFSFESAWSPPINAIGELSKQFPNLTFILKYCETGVGFAGEALCEAGEISDNCYEPDSDEYKEICEFFGMEEIEEIEE